MSKRVCKEDQIQLIMEYQFVEHIDDIWDCIEVKCVSDTMISWAIQSSDFVEVLNSEPLRHKIKEKCKNLDERYKYVRIFFFKKKKLFRCNIKTLKKKAKEQMENPFGRGGSGSSHSKHTQLSGDSQEE